MLGAVTAAVQLLCRIIVVTMREEGQINPCNVQLTFLLTPMCHELLIIVE